jgi:hypothetical protein
MTNDAQHAAHGDYLRVLADLLALRDWTVRLDVGPMEDQGRSAEVDLLYGRRIANVKVPLGFFGASAEERRHALAHELLHAHLNPSRNVLDNARSILGQPLYDLMHATMTDSIEYATDAIADALAPHLPLPPEVG